MTNKIAGVEIKASACKSVKSSEKARSVNSTVVSFASHFLKSFDNRCWT